MESSNLKTDQSSSSSSHYIKTVCLNDWWLIKSEKEVEGKSLAVAGVMTGQRAVRVFSSSPIIKRYGVFTLETADGICIVIRGIINKLRTSKNGFSSEVFKKFLFGFPPDWEEYAERCLGRECTTAIDPERSSGIESCDKINMGSRDMSTSTPTILPSSFLPEETPSKDTKLVSEDILHETNVTLEDNCNGADMGTSTPTILPSSFLPEETPSKDTKLISEDIRSSEDILHETNVTLEDNGSRTSANDGNEIHLVACTKASIEIPKDCISGNIPEKIIESNSPSNLGGRLSRSNLKSRKGHQKESLGTRSFAKDKGNEHSSAAEAFKTPDKRKLKSKSSIQIEKKDSNAKGSGIYGTKKKLKFDIHGSPLNQGEKKTSATSPESMSLKRSRSGRLLVPALAFWRNQKALYDKNGQLTAIQDGSSVVEFSRGSHFETQ